MDKTSNVGRLIQDSIKPSSAVRVDKCKRYHKVRKLSAVVKATNSDMGCDLSDRTREPLSVRDRLKFSKRLFGDCDGVDHASVPRKIRTAMKRRNRESTSSADAKKLNFGSSGFSVSNSKKSIHKIHGVQAPKKNGSKKSRLIKKQGRSDGSQRRLVRGLVTKDEEEVAETLSALAGMFADSDCTRKNTLEVSERNSSTCPEIGKISLPALEDAKADLGSNASDIAKCPPNFGRMLAEAVGNKTLKNQAGVPITKETRNELDSSFPQVNFQTVNADVPFNLSGIMQPIRQDNSLAQRMPEFTLGQANANQSQLDQHYMGKNDKMNGLDMRPGLYSKLSNVAGNGGPALWHTSPPASQDAALCNAPRALLKDASSTEKNYIAASRKPWRRCETHVYISWLIKSLQMKEKRDNLQLESVELVSDRGSNQNFFVGSAYKELTSGFNTLVPTKSDTTCASGGIHMEITEDRSDSLHPRRLQDHKQPASDSGFNILQKQGFDVPPFSSGSGELGTSSCSSMPGNRQGTSSHLQVPYFDSYMQHQVIMHASLPQNRYSSMAFPDKLSFPPVMQQAHLQLPPYVGSPLRTSPIGSLTKRHQQQLQHLGQQLHHQQFCWNYGGQDSRMLLSCSNSVLPPALKSGGLPISKCDMVVQQQQKFMPLVSSLPPGMIKRPDSNSPLYEENGGRFCSSNNNALLLQLL